MRTDTDPAQNPIVEERRNRLRQAIKAGGGNQVVAELSGVKLGTLNEYVSGRDMRLSFAAAIAKACNVALEWLATGEGSMARIDLPGGAGGQPGGLLRVVNTDRLATAMQLIDRRLPAGAAPRDRAIAVVALYDIIEPMSAEQIETLVKQQNFP